MVSGIIPEFIDILWNFNTSYILEDNLLKKFKKQNKSIIFYGDDTWLKLFNANEYFLRYEGTTSFIASDYDEVLFFKQSDLKNAEFYELLKNFVL